jgi:(p)ppGpp synthase/HD superfamily hydrolase
MEIRSYVKYFATMRHGDQKYGEFPYVKHLDDVVNVLVEFGFDSDFFHNIGYLHDILEDTDTTQVELEERFSTQQARIVALVTDNKGKNRKERKAGVYERIATDVKATILKLADMISNVRQSKLDNNRLFDMYKKEYPHFREVVYNSEHQFIQPMWDELDNLLK